MQFTITEAQLQEIAGRLNGITVQGMQNAALIVGIVSVLEAVSKQKAADDAAPQPSGK